MTTTLNRHVSENWMETQSLLVVEDDPVFQELIKKELEREGYRVIMARSGEEGLKEIRRETPDLLLLDLTLPGMDGFEVCRAVKSDDHSRNLPVIILSACDEVGNILNGLDVGAENYLTKPFNRNLLVAHVKAALDRNKSAATQQRRVLDLDGLLLDPVRQRVICGGRAISLTYTEFKLLHFLILRAEEVFSRNDLMREIWKVPGTALERAVDFQIYSLRKKLSPWSRRIKTVRGFGYKLQAKA